MVLAEHHAVEPGALGERRLARAAPATMSAGGRSCGYSRSEIDTLPADGADAWWPSSEVVTAAAVR